MRLCYRCSSVGGTSTRGLSPSAVNGRDDQLQQQKEMKRVSKSREKERERENARVILVLRMFQVR